MASELDHERIRWTITIKGIALACTYWPGPYNETTIRVSVPLVDPTKVNGNDCTTYVNGIAQDERYWKDYPEDKNPDNPRNFYTLKGGQSHSGICPFEVCWVADWVHGKPTNSPFTLRDPNLDTLCTYDNYFEYETDQGKTSRAGPFTEFRQEVSRAILESLTEQLQHSKDLKILALLAEKQVPAGVRKEEHLPFVEAALRYWDSIQAQAFDADDTARSFQAAGQQIEYARDYERLTGKPWRS